MISVLADNDRGERAIMHALMYTVGEAGKTPLPKAQRP